VREREREKERDNPHTQDKKDKGASINPEKQL
jgi:hypothetical protein